MTNMLTKLASKLTINTLLNFKNLNPIKQIGANSTKCSKIKRADGLVDFSSALELFRKFSAFYGWPGVFLDSGLKFIDIELVDTTSKNQAGEIIEITKNYIIVGCQVGKIKIKELQPKSKSKMSSYSYVNGKRIQVGDTLL